MPRKSDSGSENWIDRVGFKLINKPNTCWIVICAFGVAAIAFFALGGLLSQ